MSPIKKRRVKASQPNPSVNAGVSQSGPARSPPLVPYTVSSLSPSRPPILRPVNSQQPATHIALQKARTMSPPQKSKVITIPIIKNQPPRKSKPTKPASPKAPPNSSPRCREVQVAVQDQVPVSLHDEEPLGVPPQLQLLFDRQETDREYIMQQEVGRWDQLTRTLNAVWEAALASKWQHSPPPWIYVAEPRDQSRAAQPAAPHVSQRPSRDEARYPPEHAISHRSSASSHTSVVRSRGSVTNAFPATDISGNASYRAPPPAAVGGTEECIQEVSRPRLSPRLEITLEPCRLNMEEPEQLTCTSPKVPMQCRILPHDEKVVELVKPAIPTSDLTHEHSAEVAHTALEEASQPPTTRPAHVRVVSSPRHAKLTQPTVPLLQGTPRGIPVSSPNINASRPCQPGTTAGMTDQKLLTAPTPTCTPIRVYAPQRVPKASVEVKVAEEPLAEKGTTAPSKRHIQRAGRTKTPISMQRLFGPLRGPRVYVNPDGAPLRRSKSVPSMRVAAAPPTVAELPQYSRPVSAVAPKESITIVVKRPIPPPPPPSLPREDTTVSEDATVMPVGRHPRPTTRLQRCGCPLCPSSGMLSRKPKSVCTIETQTLPEELQDEGNTITQDQLSEMNLQQLEEITKPPAKPVPPPPLSSSRASLTSPFSSNALTSPTGTISSTEGPPRTFPTVSVSERCMVSNVAHASQLPSSPPIAIPPCNPDHIRSASVSSVTSSSSSTRSFPPIWDSTAPRDIPIIEPHRVLSAKPQLKPLPMPVVRPLDPPPSELSPTEPPAVSPLKPEVDLHPSGKVSPALPSSPMAPASPECLTHPPSPRDSSPAARDAGPTPAPAPSPNDSPRPSDPEIPGSADRDLDVTPVTDATDDKPSYPHDTSSPPSSPLAAGAESGAPRIEAPVMEQSEQQITDDMVREFVTEAESTTVEQVEGGQAKSTDMEAVEVVKDDPNAEVQHSKEGDDAEPLSARDLPRLLPVEPESARPSSSRSEGQSSVCQEEEEEDICDDPIQVSEVYILSYGFPYLIQRHLMIGGVLIPQPRIITPSMFPPFFDGADMGDSKATLIEHIAARHPGSQMLLVDDAIRNIEMAKQMGLLTVHIEHAKGITGSHLKEIRALCAEHPDVILLLDYDNTLSKSHLTGSMGWPYVAQHRTLVGLEAQLQRSDLVCEPILKALFPAVFWEALLFYQNNETDATPSAKSPPLQPSSASNQSPPIGTSQTSARRARSISPLRDLLSPHSRQALAVQG